MLQKKKLRSGAAYVVLMDECRISLSKATGRY